MGQEWLSSFTLLSIERVLNESIDFTPVIDKFATLIRGSNFPLYIGQNPWTPKFFFRSLRSLVYGILVHIINYILLTVFFLGGGGGFLTFAPSGTLPRYATACNLNYLLQHYNLINCCESHNIIQTIYKQSSTEITLLLFLVQVVEKHAKEFHFDGNFNVVPKIFYQLFTIFVHVDGHVLPAIHGLMTSKSEALYHAVFLSIRQLFPGFKPSFAIGDFEIAPKNALAQTFPYITIIGCWFHFTKAVFEKVKKIGLAKLYTHNATFKVWIRKLMALPLLPEEEIRPVYISLETPHGVIDSDNELIKRFRRYFNTTWMDGQLDMLTYQFFIMKPRPIMGQKHITDL